MVNIKSEEIVDLNILFKNTLDIRSKLIKVDENEIIKSFNIHTNNIIHTLNNRVENIHVKEIKNCEIVMAKYGLYDAVLQQIVLSAQTLSPSLGECVKNLRTIHGKLISEIQYSINDLVQQGNRINNDLNLAINDNDKLIETIKLLDIEAEEQKNSIIEARKCIESYQKEIIELKKIPNSISNKSNNSNTPTKTIKSNTKNVSITKSPASPITNNSNWLINFRSDIQKLIDIGTIRPISKNECKEILEKIYNNKKEANLKLLNLITTNANINTSTNSIETLEQYFYHYFEKKFGLRSLAVENATKTILSLELYRVDDIWIDIFHKIFRNEIDEDYMIIQNQLIKSIDDLLAFKINEIKNITDKNILNREVEKKKTSYLFDFEWISIIEHLYNAEDSSKLNNILLNIANDMNLYSNEITNNTMKTINTINNDNIKKFSSPKQKMTHKLTNLTNEIYKYNQNSNSIKLQFSLFLKTVLEFQLQSHIKFLSKFRDAFCSFDNDGDGILTAYQFRKCFQCLSNNIDDDDDNSTFGTLLSLVDPLNSNFITFSMASSNLAKIFI